jgi:hypothetical protein
MCFSAEASFISGIVLTSAGVLTLKKTTSRSQLAFASIPLIFGIQQLTEGFLWIALLHSQYSWLQQPATYIFLVFAQVVWPSWVPFSILLLEKDKARKKILYLMLGIGLVVSVCLLFRLLTETTRSEIIGHHIFYDLSFPASVKRTFGILYFISTVLTPFISSTKRMWALGFTILLSYIITKIFFENYVISVWCFLAAVISVTVYFIIAELNKPLEDSSGKKVIIQPRHII